jgi:hypothetical protein
VIARGRRGGRRSRRDCPSSERCPRTKTGRNPHLSSSAVRIPLESCQIKRDLKISALFIWCAWVRASGRVQSNALRQQAMPAGRVRIFCFSGVLSLRARIDKSPLARALIFGAPGEIRTPDHLVRSQVLYPAELRAQI